MICFMRILDLVFQSVNVDSFTYDFGCRKLQVVRHCNTNRPSTDLLEIDKIDELSWNKLLITT